MALTLPACIKTSHDVNVNVQPLHITLDVNIRVDRQLDDFFSFENQATQPATQPAEVPAS
ncbi:MAG: hypothetical protein IT440_02315 [Phycisphaeraceae bacterium]|nr:hypothetical protein [Phycisphaeraceae bacterium]